jgi:DNA-binding MarR family transcriptional regulator
MKLEQEIKQEKFRNPEQKLTINLIFTYYWIVDRFKEHLRPYDISMQQFNILRILRGQGNKPATINLLKDRMMDRSSDASRLVERLRLKGLVERVICPEDRRAVEIRITEKGTSILKTIDEQEASMSSNFNTLTPEEIATVNDLLDKLRG